MRPLTIRYLWGAAAGLGLIGGLLWVFPPPGRPPDQPAPDVTLPEPPVDPSEHAGALLAYEEIARANVFTADRSPPASRYTPGGAPAAAARPASTTPSLRLYGLAVGPDGAVALIDADPTIPGAEIYRVGDQVGLYRLLSIADTFVVLAGPAGERTLRLQTPQRRSP